MAGRQHLSGSTFILSVSSIVLSWCSRLRDELLNLGQFDSLLEAQVLIEDHRIDYNTNRPHSAHENLTPAEFAAHWTTINQPQPA